MPKTDRDVMTPKRRKEMAPEYQYKAQVERVIDGDTIVFRFDMGMYIDKRDQYVRLKGINTPELRGAEKEAGKRAKDFVIETLNDSQGMWRPCVVETFKDKRGKYGRWLGIIWYYDETKGYWINLNAQLVREGRAKLTP